jgi:lipoyl-dependent peroxiredoxin subunit C
MAVRVGQSVPAFEADAWTRGANNPARLKLSQYSGKWVVLFFYPRDFTFICPTEIASFGTMEPDFEAEDAVIIGASTDSFYSHKAWFESEPRLSHIKFPVIADTGHQVAKHFDVLLEDGATLRGTFIIDPDGVLRQLSVNSLDVGRDVRETLRLLQALRTGELCPCAWGPGQKTLTTYDQWWEKQLPLLTQHLKGQSQSIKYQKGQNIFKQGDASKDFYVVDKGEADVIRSADGKETIVATLGPNNHFGEIGLLTGRPRNATIRAKTELELLTLNWDDFKKMADLSIASREYFAEIMKARTISDKNESITAVESLIRGYGDKKADFFV